MPLYSIDAGAPADPALDVSGALWVGLGALVVVMLAFDLFVFARGRREPTLAQALGWSALWIGLAVGFAVWMWTTQGAEAAGEFVAGYLLEKSLSVDNVFVFAVIFGAFAVPLAVQTRALAWGIALALALRLVFILVGAALLEAFHATVYVFGVILLVTAWRLWRHKGEPLDVERSRVLRLVRRYVPMTDSYDGTRLVVRRGGVRLATPLVAVLALIAATDIVFALDSIPAIYAVTSEPFIVFAANAFALLGLRALYFALAGLVERFVYLSYGLAALLAFVAVKMLLSDVWKVPTALSLGVIAGVLGVAVAASVVTERRRAPSSACSGLGS